MSGNESPAQRRRRLRQGWTDEDLRAEEDQIAARNRLILGYQSEIIDLTSKRTAKATEAAVTKGDRHRQRAADLKATGLSAARIGARMALEEQRSEPYPERTVRRWLAPKKG